MTVGTFILPAGRLGDLYGHKKFFVLGALWFALWSMIAGLSVYVGSRIFFDFCRAMQGIGPAFMLPNAVAILGRTYAAGKKQKLVFSLFGASAPNGSVIGAVFTSIFAQLVWWPWAYYATAIACVFTAIVGVFVIPHTPRPVFADPSVSMITRIDVPGSVTGVTGLVLINFAWNQAPIVGWDTPYVYILLIAGFLFMGAFATIESRSRFPLIPFEYMNSNVGFVLGCMALGWSSFGIWIYYVVQLFQEYRGTSLLLTSAMMSPTTISGLCAALVCGYILRHIPASYVMICAMTAFAIGNVLVATMPIHQVYWLQAFFTMIITPWGM